MNQLFFEVDPFNNSLGLGVPKFDMHPNLGVGMDVKNIWMNQNQRSRLLQHFPICVWIYKISICSYVDF